MPAPKKIIDELIAKRRVAEKPPVFDLSSVLFKQQLPFGLDASRYQTAVTPRRAGKTYAIAGKLISVALSKPGCVALYITLSRINAKRIVWETLKEMNRSHKLGGEVMEGDLCIDFQGRGKIYLSGASDKSEVEKFRGLALGIVIIDEAQSFPSYLEQLVDEVLAPALTDYAGSLCLVGTPGPVPIGYFHDKTTSIHWAHHTWSVFDNVHLARKSGRATQSLLEDELKRRGVTQDDPVIQREWFGRWALDENSLVFRWTAANVRPTKKHQHHVLGVDIGFDDADALAVLGWSDDAPELDIVYEWVGSKQSITGLMGRVKEQYERFAPLAVVMDTGGLGKKIAEEIQMRTSIPIEAAEKDRKLEHIELLNDALRTLKLFAPADSRFAQDCMLVEWDKSNPEKPKISDRFHSDICDAVLYAYRRCLQWLWIEPEKPAPKVNTPEWHQTQAAAQLAQIEAEFQKQMKANKQAERDERMANEWS